MNTTIPSNPARSLLGTQIWLEQHDDPARVDDLFRLAAETGFGWVRLFLMWPWMEPEPGQWDFRLYDSAFDAAARHGIKIKATLTANSGPSHIGIPSVLSTHSGFLTSAQKEAAAVYVRQCASRYASHPALGQWVLWNEPFESGVRSEAALTFWRNWLAQRYAGDLSALNGRWRTRYDAFSVIPFAEEVPLPIHKGYQWQSYRPWLDDWQCRAAWLVAQLQWISDLVRESDPVTPTCINPVGNLANQADAGTDLHALGAITSVMGASFHPPFHFLFAQRHEFPSLIAAGVRHQASVPTVRRVEVTEVQTGNQAQSAMRPCDCSPGEIARFHLAALAAGAESVTGWCFNTRSQDAEAGDWALLNDLDRPSPRSRMVRRVHDRLAATLEVTGAWSAARSRAWVLMDPHSQAIETMISRMTYGPVPGVLAGDSASGAALLAVEVQRLGIPTSIARLGDQLAEGNDLIVVSQLVSWSDHLAGAVLDRVEAGATLLFDAVCGRLDGDAVLQRSWPAGWSDRIGLLGAGLQTSPGGHAVTIGGRPAGRMIHTRMVPELLSPEWTAWDDLRFADGEACVLERPFGKGRIIACRGVLGPSLVHAQGECQGIEYLLRRASGQITVPVRPVAGHPATIALPVNTAQGEMVVILAPDRQDRNGQPLRLQICESWRGVALHDFWTGQQIELDTLGELTLPAEEGVAILLATSN